MAISPELVPHGSRVLRIAAIVVGGLLVWMSLCLYEDDVGQVVDILDRWWNRTQDVGKVRISRQALFAREIARLASQVFDSLFGARLLSLRSIGVTTSFSVASGLLFSLWDQPDLTDICIVAALLTLGLLPLYIRKPVWLRVWFVFALSPALFWAALIDFFVTYGGRRESGVVLLPVLLGFACDIGFIAFTRWLLTWILSRTDALAMLVVLILNFTVAFSLVGVPLILAGRVQEGSDSNTVLTILGSTNIIDAAASALWVFFALLMLIHRLFWPVLSRTLYGVKSLGVLKWRKTIGALGTLLIGVSNEKGEKIVTYIWDKVL